MEIFGKECSVSAKGFSDICDITDNVKTVVEESGLDRSLITIHIIGSTGSISTIEFEPALVADMRDKLEEFASKNQPTRHGETWGDDNGFSHLRATLLGPGITVPQHNGQPLLGTWQQIVLINHDNRPRERRFFVQIIGKA